MAREVSDMAQKILERPPPGLDKAMDKISATEELCIEHAMLDRIFLAMDHTLKMAGSGKKADLSPIKKACGMIEAVVNQHHMKIEEDEIYPKFARDAMLSPLVEEFKVQHDEARKMVARIDQLSRTAGGKANIDELNAVFTDLKDMLTAHAAREETVLFPAMQGTWAEKDLKALKETQEEHEEKLLGKDAGEKIYAMLGDVEASAGIDSVRDFTRRLK
jgi:hemerythrin-like domain-containing protein